MMQSRLLPRATEGDEAAQAADSTATPRRRVEDAPRAAYPPLKFRSRSMEIEAPAREGPVGFPPPVASPAPRPNPAATAGPPIPSRTPSASGSPVRGAPVVSRRPRGKWLIAFILLALCVVSVRTVWTLFLRDSAHGVVTGDVLQIMPPWRGELRSLEVEVGDTVRRGDVLAVICDPNLEIALSRARDELVLATAQRDAKIAELSVAAATRADQLQQQRAQYYRLQAELQAERAHRDELAGKLVRREQLLDAKAVSNDELESIRIRKRGAQQQIESLQQAAHELELRLQQVTHTATDDIQSRPSSARIDQLRNEIGRLEAQIQRQTLRSPVDAVVVHVDIHPGEYADPERAVIELLEKDSQEFVLFVDQRQADKFAAGRRLQVSVEPDGRRVPCQVVRVGQRFDKPSVPLPGGQPPDQRRLPVWLRPEPGATGDRPVPLGSAVRLPVMWNLVSRGTIE